MSQSLYEKMTERETVICRHCRDKLEEGDVFYYYQGETYCPDCMEAIVNAHRHVVGEAIDLI